MLDPSAYFIVALVAIGMGLSFLTADPKSPTSRALALTLGLFGGAVITYTLEHLHFFPGHPFLWPRLHSIFEAGSTAAGIEWILRVGRTHRSTDLHYRLGEGLLRVAQGLIAVFGLLGLALPALRSELLDRGWNPTSFTRPEYYLLAGPFYLSIFLATIRIVQLLRCELDRSEKLRLVAFTEATPLFIAMVLVPTRWGPFLAVVGELILLAGAVRYHVLQGQRGQFLARFLAPQVARLVQERGLSSTMQQSRVQLSVVACDVRGFTAFAETAAPEDVLQFLRDYYEVIGQAVTEFGGTIKDFAGDGILTLVGAPISYPDHARRSVELALRIRERGGEVLDRWKGLGSDLGLGVGVASGFVTVGTISSAGRLEYAAIGPAVNLAARLCDRAETGQVLIDQRTIGLIGENGGAYRLETLEAIDLKGFSRPVPVFSIPG